MNEEEKQAVVPYFVHEGQMARMERIIKRLTATIVAVLAVALVMFIVNNLIWMRYVKTAANPVNSSAEVTDAGVQQQPDSADHQ